MHSNESGRKNIYLFKSKVDSNWKTWAREKTVLVFFLRFPWIPFSEPSLQPDGSNDAVSSSPMSGFSSSDSSSCSRYVEWELGDLLPLTLIVGDTLFSLRLVEVFSETESNLIKTQNKVILDLFPYHYFDCL